MMFSLMFDDGQHNRSVSSHLHFDFYFFKKVKKSRQLFQMLEQTNKLGKQAGHVASVS